MEQAVGGPRRFAISGAEVGEGPIYDPDADVLYWVDIPRGHLWRCRPGSHPERQSVDEPLGSIALIDGGGFLLGARRGILVLADWNATPSLWSEVEPDRPTQFNDGKCDSRGRFLAGTTSPERRCDGSLYRVDHDGAVRRLLGGVGMSNGLGWSPDDRYFYYVDSPAQVVTRYDWDAVSGELANPQPFIHVSERDGLPDGLTVDADGCVWLAVWGSGEVRRHDREGVLIGSVTVPTPNVTSCTFGGPNLSELYITSASAGVDPDSPARTGAGDVYVVGTNTHGLPPSRFPRHSIPPSLLG